MFSSPFDPDIVLLRDESCFVVMWSFTLGDWYEWVCYWCCSGGGSAGIVRNQPHTCDSSISVWSAWGMKMSSGDIWEGFLETCGLILSILMEISTLNDLHININSYIWPSVASMIHFVLKFWGDFFGLVLFHWYLCFFTWAACSGTRGN